MSRWLSSWAVLVLIAATPAFSPQEAGQGLPVREITLYRSGVGYFEHAQTIAGDLVWRLRFPARSINDILKSMTLLDGGGGTIGPVSYGSKEPLERRLASFGVDISKAPDSVQLFSQLRGAGLRIHTADGAIEGTILGVEDRFVGDTAVKQSHVNLITARGVRSINVASIATFELTEAPLAEELKLALQALAEQRSEQTKTVELSFRGPSAPPRQVMLSYVREMPVWKASYRLVMPKDASQSPTMQGWAIVENTTGEDWRGVRLSLASGRPVSFTMDLYEPIFAERPSVAVPLEEGVVPRVYEGSADVARRRAELIAEAASLADAVASGDPAAISRMKELDQHVVEAESLGEAQATGEQVGGQFLYTVDTPVTLERQQSAMLPILVAAIRGRRVTIFSPLAEETPGAARQQRPLAKLQPLVDESTPNIAVDPYEAPEHPMRGVELTNDTALHLMPGPIAVFDAGTYAGDAQIPHTARGQKRLLSYASDLDVQALSRGSASHTVVRLRIAGGMIEQRFKERQARDYVFTNLDAKLGRTILVEHPKKDQGWLLVEPPAPAGETAGFYRFEVEVPAGGQGKLTVALENEQSSHIKLESLPLDSALELQRTGRVSAAVVEALKQAAELLRAVRSLDANLGQLDRERQEITKEQERIRGNLGQLEKNSDLYRRYIQKLGDQETRLEQIASQKAELDDKRKAAQTAYDDYVRNLDVD